MRDKKAKVFHRWVGIILLFSDKEFLVFLCLVMVAKRYGTKEIMVLNLIGAPLVVIPRKNESVHSGTCWFAKLPKSCPLFLNCSINCMCTYLHAVSLTILIRYFCLYICNSVFEGQRADTNEHKCSNRPPFGLTSYMQQCI